MTKMMVVVVAAAVVMVVVMMDYLVRKLSLFLSPLISKNM